MERHELIQVKIELGHKAWCRKQPTREGFTHDWVMFVRGPDNSDVSHFVEKVVFLLHESFPKPKRVVKDPPYKLEECGYGSFHLPVEVYFKNKEEPKKVFFEYDLLLPGLGLPPVSNIRSEALTFKNPTDEFKRKVLKAGGVVISNANGYHSSSVNGNGSQISSSCKTVKKSSSANSSPTGETLDRTPAKKIKSDKTVKSKLSNESASPVPATLSSKRPADTDGGMTPVTKKKKKSPENSKSRLVGFLLDSADGIKEKKEESIKHKLKALAGKGNVEKSEKGEKKKERKVPLESPIATKKKDSTSAVKKGKEKMTTSPEQEHKITVKSETKLSTKSVSKPIPKTEMKTPKKEEKVLIKSIPKIVKSAVKQERKDLTSREPKSHSKLDSKHKHLKKEGKKVEKITIRRNSNESWSSSASSSSSLFTGGPAAANANKNNALGTLLAELGDDEDDDIDVCGLSDSSKQIECMQPSSETGKVSSVHSNASTNNNNVKTLANGGLSKHSSNSQNERHEPSLKKQNDNKSMVKQKETEKLHLQKSGHKVKLESEKLSSSSGKTFASNLLTLHKKLTSLKDSASLQKVVDILETTGSFVITETSFKFDLCTLDPEIVRKIESCVNR